MTLNKCKQYKEDKEVALASTVAAKFEGFSKTIYKCPEGFKTVGFGRNLEVFPWVLEELVNDFNHHYPEYEAYAWLREQMQSTRRHVLIHHPWAVTAPQAIRLILTDMAYNIGQKGLNGFVNMLAAMREGLYLIAAEQLKDSKYYTQTGRRSKAHYATLRSLGTTGATGNT